MNFKESIVSGYKKYVTFSGRASRSEYWYFTLFIFIAYVVLSILDVQLFGVQVATTTSVTPNSMSYQASMDEVGPLVSLFMLASALPCLAVAVRRLHDTNYKGWWLLISLIPLLGPLFLIIRYCTKGTEGSNRFGADPLQAAQ